jgi:hypothetical protein
MAVEPAVVKKGAVFVRTRTCVCFLDVCSVLLEIQLTNLFSSLKFQPDFGKTSRCVVADMESR